MLSFAMPQDPPSDLQALLVVHPLNQCKFWDGREVRYDSSSIPQLDLAYAISVHRSQGSEVPVVVLVVHDSHAILLERQLLYTGVTRAKRLLIIVGTRRAYALAVKKTRSKNRFTSLVERTRTALGIDSGG